MVYLDVCVVDSDVILIKMFQGDTQTLYCRHCIVDTVLIHRHCIVDIVLQTPYCICREWRDNLP